MKRSSKEMMQVQVGIFVVVGLCLSMMVLFLLGGEKKFFDRHYSLSVQFKDISGVRVGSPVKLAGINIGYVGEIAFDDKLANKEIVLSLKVKKPYQDRIRKDSTAQIMTQGLLGDKMVAISVGSADKEVLKDGEFLVAKAPSDFSEMFSKGDELLSTVNRIAKKLDVLVTEIDEGEGLLHQLIYDFETADLLEDLKVFAASLKTASSNVAQMTRKTNEGQGTVGALINDASLYNDMKTLLGKANRNKLIRTVIRHTLKTKDEKLLEK